MAPRWVDFSTSLPPSLRKWKSVSYPVDMATLSEPAGNTGSRESGSFPSWGHCKCSLPRPSLLSLFSMGPLFLWVPPEHSECPLFVLPPSMSPLFSPKTLVLQQSFHSIYKKHPGHLSYQLDPFCHGKCSMIIFSLALYILGYLLACLEHIFSAFQDVSIFFPCTFSLKSNLTSFFFYASKSVSLQHNTKYSKMLYF